MAVKKPKAFHIYLDTYDHMQLLTMEQRGELLTALYEFALNGTLTEFQNGSLRMAFSFMRAQISRDFEKYQEKCDKLSENAKRKKKDSAKASNCYHLQAIASNCSQEEEKEKEKYKEEYKEEKEEYKEEEKKKTNTPSSSTAVDAPSRTPYGIFNNVLLTDNELSQLKSRYPYDYEGKIERLSRYIESTGKRYSNHYATLLSWLEEDAAKPPRDSSASYDINELQKIDTLDFVDEPNFQQERKHTF